MKQGFVKTAALVPELRLADCEFNAKTAEDAIKEAARCGVKIMALPEMCLCGYTCGDLFGQETLLDAAKRALEILIKATAEIDALVAVGLPIENCGKLYNAAAVFCKGKVLGIVAKKNISDYGEFSESRWFSPAPEENGSMRLFDEDVPFGAKLIFDCRDMDNLTVGVEIGDAVQDGVAANIVLKPSASCETVGKAEWRRMVMKSSSDKNICAYVYSGADTGESSTDLVFSGHCMISENGKIIAENARFAQERLTVSEVDVNRLACERRRMGYAYAECDKIEFSLEAEECALTRKISQSPFLPEDESERTERCEEILNIQTAGLKRRWSHTRSNKIVLGISGGLDSALALLVAVRCADKMGVSRKNILAVTMPCFGTTLRTKGNAEKLCECLGVELKYVDIKAAVNQHFSDIGMEPERRDAAYENSQARERTQVLMDIANMYGGFVLGTGDLSELALGWATYNGDHMSMYGVNAAIPKTLVRYLVGYEAERLGGEAGMILADILDTPVSPELLPAQDGEIVQKTEDLVGPYELHDFYLYYALRWGYSPSKVYRTAKYAFGGAYDDGTLKKWLKNFYRRFFTQQFKRSCLPDGPKVGTDGLSPRGDWRMPSDAVSTLWSDEAEKL